MAKLKDSRVYGNLDIDSVLTVSSDTTINGNLTVTGNTIYSYVDTMKITDPILEMGGADAGALSSDDNKDRGSLLHYYDGGVVDAFMGWDNSASEFALGSNVSVTNEVVTFNEYGNLRVGTIFGSGAGLSAIPGSNVTGTVAYANFSSYAGIVTASNQPNITSVGTLVDLDVTGAANIGGDLDVTGGASVGGDLGVTGNATVTGNLTVTGTIYADVAGSLTAPGTTTQVLFNDAGQVNAVSGFTFNKTTHALTLSGNVTGDTIIGNLFSGNGANLSSITGSNVTGYVPDADHATIANIANVAYSVDGANVSGEVAVANTVSNSNQSNITQVGSLLSLNVVGDIYTQANIEVDGTASIAGNANVGNLGTTGVYATGSINGATANITGDATVGGNISVTHDATVSGTVTATVGANVGNLRVNGTTHGNLIPDANVAYDLGNLTNRWNDLYLSGNTIYLGDQTIESNATTLFTSADLAANNITATTNVTSGNVYANTGTVKAAHLLGVVDTAAQPNITSVGTLVDLDVTGNVAAGGLLTDNLYYANGVAWDLQQAAGSNTQLQFNLNGDFGSDANLTFDAGYAGGALSAPHIRATGLAGLEVTNSANIYGNVSVTYNVSTGGNITATGNANSGNVYTTNVTATGDASITGNVSALSVTSDDVTASSGNLTLSGQGADGHVILAPTGTGTISASSKRITSVGTPTADGDAATKAYVDSVAQGLAIKASAHLATTADLSATYDNGTSGVGATLTGGQAALSVDNHATDVGDRILVKNQTNASENGLYEVTTQGVTGTTEWVLTRVADMNQVAEVYSAFVFVDEGSTNAHTGWVVSSTDESFTTFGDDITWTQFSGAGTYSADGGLLLNGTVFSADVDNSTIDLDNDGKIHVKDGLTLVTPNIGAATGTSLNLTGAANVGTDLTVTGNVDANNFNGTFYGTFTGTVDATVGAAGTNTQVQFNDAGNIGANSTFTFNKTTSTLSVGNVTVTGDVSGGTLTGALTTAAQPNVTSVGTLTSLTVAGNITTTGTAGNISGANYVIANFFSGNGSALSSITGANVTGTVANATYATNAGTAYSVSGSNVSGDVSGANHANVADSANAVAGGNVSGQVGNALIAGTVYTAAQPNITSVGTLIDLDVTGNVTTGGIRTDNYYYANGASVDFQTAAGNAGEIQFKSSAGNDLAASANFKFNGSTNVLTVTGNVSVSDTLSAANVSATNLTGTLTTAAQTNITSVGTLDTVTVAGASNLGAVGNVHITGGTSGQYLQTDGTGSLSWATINTSRIANGSSNVSIPAADGNVFINVGATEIIEVSGVGANITGVLDVSGNVTANNITAANVIVASGGIAANSAITGTVKVAGGMSATGNIYTGKAVGFANNNGGTDSAAYIQFNSTANSLDFIFN